MIGQSYPSFTATIYDSLSSGYYFLAPLPLGVGTPINTPSQMIIDHNANVVYYKSVGSAINIGDFKIQEAIGQISYSTANKFRLMDSSFTIIDSVRCKAGIIPDDHDMQVLPNGHFLLIGYENVTMDLSSYNLFSGTGAPGSTTATVRFGVIQEQDANKNIVFEWHSKDYFSFVDMDTKWLSSPTFVDFTHFNAVELDTDGNILVSSRHLNEITKINRTTGAVMWRLGGNANQFTFTNDTEMFKAQHDIRRITNGNITLFDNGEPGVPFHPATAKEYQLDETTLTATLVWSYVNEPSIYSTAMGNVQRHANGNTLINYGWYRGSNTLFTVVNPSGAKVFELSFPDSLRSYRSFYYPTLPF
ncbi:MAG: aryl-sulfate sulfotransferase [Bacteroidetes bacterium]|nr:aryl-sulfate sulfotransferase [Bacteroidota bacterium]